MITRDSPLAEVAAHLPTASAGLLLKTSSAVQTLVLTELRSIFCRWEQSGLHHDPITFEATVTPIVEHLVIDNMTIVGLSGQRPVQGVTHDDEARS